jgi:hypothetical protein
MLLNVLTTAKNLRPISRMQAYIAYLHSRRIFRVRHSLPSPNQQQQILHLGDVPERTRLVECAHRKSGRGLEPRLVEEGGH